MDVNKLNLEWRLTEELKAYNRNTKKHPTEQVTKIAASIKEFGFNNPILIDQDQVIIAGHGRLLAAIELGMKTVPTIRLTDLSPAQVKAYRIMDNKSAESEWDLEVLGYEFQDLKDEGFDLSLTGFDSKEVFFPEEELTVEDDEFVAVDAYERLKSKTHIKLGEVFKLGDHRLMCGDSTKSEDVGVLMLEEKADLLFTDPPYNVAFNGRSGKFEVMENDDLSDESFNEFIKKVCDTIKNLRIPNYYVWCNWKFYGILQKELEFKSCIVWAKNVFGLGIGYRHQHEFCLFNGKIDSGINNETDLWQVKKDHNYLHPTQKPIELCARALNNHKEAVIVLDLFGGSGSTLIACEQLKRKCRMMELDPVYCQVIIERWEKLTNKKAEELT